MEFHLLERTAWMLTKLLIRIHTKCWSEWATMILMERNKLQLRRAISKHGESCAVRTRKKLQRKCYVCEIHMKTNDFSYYKSNVLTWMQRGFIWNTFINLKSIYTKRLTLFQVWFIIYQNGELEKLQLQWIESRALLSITHTHTHTPIQ